MVLFPSLCQVLLFSLVLSSSGGHLLRCGSSTKFLGAEKLRNEVRDERLLLTAGTEVSLGLCCCGLWLGATPCLSQGHWEAKQALRAACGRIRRRRRGEGGGPERRWERVERSEGEVSAKASMGLGYLYGDDVL